MKKVLTAIFISTILFVMAVVPVSASVETLNVPEDTNAVFTVGDPDPFQRLRVYVGTSLFTITVNSLSANTLISTKDSGKTFSSADTSIGVLVSGTKMSSFDTGSAYFYQLTGTFVSTGKVSLNAYIPNGTFTRTVVTGATDYGYIKNTGTTQYKPTGGSMTVEFIRLGS